MDGDEDIVSSLCRSLSAFYWSLMPETERVRIVRFYRDHHRRVTTRRRVCFSTGVVVVAVIGFMLMRLVLMGRCGGTVVSLFLDAGYIVLAYWLLCDMWRGIYVMKPPRL